MKILRGLKARILGEKTYLAGDYPAVADCLRRILGTKVWEGIKRTTPDRRQIMEAAAIAKGVSEEELIKIVAERLDMPVFFRPRPVDVDYLPAGIILPDLRRAGILPIIAQAVVTGIVCVDPAELNIMRQLYAGRNIYLSSWQAILASLDESEQLYRKKKTNEEIEKKERNARIYKKILGRLVQQASVENSAQIVLISDLESLVYSFIDKSGRQWSGNIDTKVARPLRQYLEESLAEGLSSIDALGCDDEILPLNLGAEHGRILLGLEPALFNTSSAQEGAKIVPFPRLVKTEGIEAESMFAKGGEPEILLVEDNPAFALVLEKFLAKYRICMEICYSAEEALSMLRDRNRKLPDLILSDLHLPGASGIEFIRLLKHDQILKQIPIVVLTSDESAEAEITLLGLGVDAFVTKTKDPRILCLHARRLIELKRAA